MPSTKTHDFLTLTSASAGLALYAKAVPHPDWVGAGIVACSYVFSGLMLSADLDVASRGYRRWGPLRFIWWPYQKLIPHRSWLSHGLVVGPMLRVLYLCLVLGIPLALLVMWGEKHGISLPIFAHLFRFVRSHLREVALALAGIVLGGAMHSVADVVGSLLKRLLRLWRRGLPF